MDKFQIFTMILKSLKMTWYDAYFFQTSGQGIKHSISKKDIY